MQGRFCFNFLTFIIGNPEAPSRFMVYTYTYQGYDMVTPFTAHVCTIQLDGAFGKLLCYPSSSPFSFPSPSPSASRNFSCGEALPPLGRIFKVASHRIISYCLESLHILSLDDNYIICLCIYDQRLARRLSHLPHRTPPAPPHRHAPVPFQRFYSLQLLRELFHLPPWLWSGFQAASCYPLQMPAVLSM